MLAVTLIIVIKLVCFFGFAYFRQRCKHKLDMVGIQEFAWHVTQAMF